MAAACAESISQSGRENLCERARFTGYTLDGLRAEYMLADERSCFPIYGSYDDVATGPIVNWRGDCRTLEGLV